MRRRRYRYRANFLALQEGSEAEGDLKVYAVSGWDEPPRGVFGSKEAARQFAESQNDYRIRELNEDGTGHDCYPFIQEYEVSYELLRTPRRK